MNVSSFFVRVLVLALPGIIAFLVYRKLRGGAAKKNWLEFTEVVIFSLLSYSLYGFLVAAGLFDTPFTSVDAILDPAIPVRWSEVSVASICGVLLAYIAAYVYKYRLVNVVGEWVGASRRYGSEDVWERFHNSPETDEWILVRDHKLELVYFGWIHAYSETGKERELIMKDVQVYSNNTGDHLYDVATMYIGRQRYELSLELPEPPSQ